MDRVIFSFATDVRTSLTLLVAKFDGDRLPIGWFCHLDNPDRLFGQWLRQ